MLLMILRREDVESLILFDVIATSDLVWSIIVFNVMLYDVSITLLWNLKLFG